VHNQLREYPRATIDPTSQSSHRGWCQGPEHYLAQFPRLGGRHCSYDRTSYPFFWRWYLRRRSKRIHRPPGSWRPPSRHGGSCLRLLEYLVHLLWLPYVSPWTFLLSAVYIQRLRALQQRSFRRITFWSQNCWSFEFFIIDCRLYYTKKYTFKKNL